MSIITKFKSLLLSLPSRSDLRWALTPITIEQRASILRQNILYKNDLGVESKRYDGREVVVSLTTFGNRIEFTALAIESIMEQTMKANRIILWLGNSFDSPGRIPRSLKLLEKRGLEIRFCEDLGPQTKLMPSLKSFPDDIIITIDDDCYYDYDVIDHLYRTYLDHPNSVCGNMVMSITNEEGDSMPFDKWSLDVATNLEDHRTLAMGVGGVLYPPYSLCEEVFDTKRMRQLCPKADDIWFKAMELKKGTSVVRTNDIARQKGRYFLPHLYDDSVKLETYNVFEGGNDVQFNAVFDYYDLKKVLKSQSLSGNKI